MVRVLEDVLVMFLWIYLSWSAMSCAVYGDNCGLRQKVKLGHLSKCWDSELLPLFCGYFEAAAALQYVIYLGWWHLGVFKLKPYGYRNPEYNIYPSHLQSSLSLVCMNCPMSYIDPSCLLFFRVQPLFFPPWAVLTLGNVGFKLQSSLFSRLGFLGLVMAKGAG